ncbi:hypothetical protein Zmor_021591 [Zophobas morio]|uniref:Uncharacterized protein n=1 Tax=Zophobas morio TaxID=2755281 RepID=A0AA38I2X9_9CUCU|nr:hypothetical protein Zmor_021591 [Zophobas morio]
MSATPGAFTQQQGTATAERMSNRNETAPSGSAFSAGDCAYTPHPAGHGRGVSAVSVAGPVLQGSSHRGTPHVPTLCVPSVSAWIGAWCVHVEEVLWLEPAPRMHSGDDLPAM